MRDITRRVLLLWTEIDGLPIPTLRAQNGELIEPVSTYLDKFSQSCASIRDARKRERKVRAVTYALSELTEFLFEERKSLRQLDDTMLVKFRDAACEATLRSPASRGHAYQAETTTNIKLRYIYDCLDACQYARLLPQGTIGWEHCRVKSSLPDVRTRGSSLDVRHSRKYPQLFDQTGAKTQIDLGQYWMSDEDVRLVEEYFRNKPDPHAQERNVLLLRVGEIQGWRAASINSLTINQFSPEELKAQENYDRFVIRPTSQKGRTRFAFEMRWELVNAISEYISGARASLLRDLGKDEKTAEFRLFLSVTEGTPLDDKTITQIFSTALRSLGRPKGAAAHSMRRRKGQSLTKEEIEFRKREHLSVAKEDIEDAVARELGHASREAQRAYVLYHKIKHLQSVEEKQRDLIEQLKFENGSLKVANRDLRQKIADLLENRVPGSKETQKSAIKEAPKARL